MWSVDVFATYLYGLKLIAISLAIIILISGIDDLVIDVVYWVRRFWRWVTVYRLHDRLDPKALYEPTEKPFAIMVPAWNERGVIGRMAELAATTLDYEDYHVFVGTYPNDPDTQREVDEVCARFPNVHKVVCARPGPTSKADCLNNVLDAILQFENRAKVEFAGFILHDAEDVISEMELRLFNYLVDRKDLIQLPVYPFERKWFDFTSAHYMDEFAEVHGKDILVREALAGQVPSAGVGSCFSRRAVMALLADGDGIAFDVQSLTEDYDIGFRLRAKGMSEIFVRFPVKGAETGRDSWGKISHDASVVCVREFFPNTLKAAVRQKSRWIIGIVFQGFRNHRWTSDLAMDYFLWRDRKGGLVNFVSFLASLVFLQLVGLWIYSKLADDPYQFIAIFEGDRWLTLLLFANLLLMLNRMAQRMYFVTGYYGLFEGVLSIPRLFWGNLVNFLANCRAIVQIVRYGDVRRVAWDKTTHDFPVLGEPNRARRPLGQILIEQGSLREDVLNAALAAPRRGLKLGSALVHGNWITTEQLAAAVAVQSGVEWESVDAFQVPARLIEQVPAELALHYAILPLREEGGTLVVASESDLDPVATAALARKLERSIRYVIAPKGQVTVGLRHWYARLKTEDPRAMLDAVVASGRLPRTRADVLWKEFVSRQVLLADVLTSLGHLDGAALRSSLLRHERTASGLGEYLVSEGIISREVLHEALALQSSLQSSMEALLERAGVRKPWLGAVEAKAV
jgi:adsorption protein B